MVKDGVDPFADLGTIHYRAYQLLTELGTEEAARAALDEIVISIEYDGSPLVLQDAVTAAVAARNESAAVIESLLFSIVGVAHDPPVIMHENGRTYDLTDELEDVPASLLEPKKKAPPTFPLSWPSSMVKAAKKKLRHSLPSLTGGPLGI